MRLSRSLFWMAAFLAVVAGVAALLIVRLKSAFLANPYLNAMLIAVLLIGIAYIFLQTLKLGPEIKWVHAVQRNRLAAKEMEPPALMGSLARLMEDRTTPLMLTPTALRAVLDGIAVRLDESREIARYLIGLMIFLGLLGTFWGLLKTVGSVGGVVNGLSMTADPTELFNTLKSGLEGPLAGMATAFGSSLLGLAGSLVLGFLDLQMGQAQNRFFIDLEDWLFASSREDVTPASSLQSLADQTAVNVDRFHEIMIAADESQRQTTAAIQYLANGIEALLQAQNLDRAAQADTQARANENAETLYAHLRSIDDGIKKIADDQTQIRLSALEEARNEIKRLARVIEVAVDERLSGGKADIQ